MDYDSIARITRLEALVYTLQDEVKELRSRVGNIEHKGDVIATDGGVACGAGGIAVRGDVKGTIAIGRRD